MSTLDELNRLSRAELNDKIHAPGNPVKKEVFMEQLLHELSDPDKHINQHNRGTCTVTAMTHQMATNKPAEYARLVIDLAKNGSSRLPNGDKISVPGNDAWIQDNSDRSHGERLLQSSLMQYARPEATYKNSLPPTSGTNGSIDGFTDTQKSGLKKEQEMRVMSGLNGKTYTRYYGDGDGTSAEDKKKMTERIRQDLKEGRGPVLITMQWNGGYHAIEVTKVADPPDNKVTFRNPWGGNNVDKKGDAKGNANNATHATGGPLRTVEDPQRGIESMPVEDFHKWVGGVNVPANS
jgi:hypothetical protein